MITEIPPYPPYRKNKLNTLLEKNRAGELRSEDKQRWEQYEYLERLVRLAKAKAYLKLKQSHA
ncbi:hypothetical protein [Planktothrix paucivesiculata]|uniref:Uncharacterized protein n=1 Tax=Planktothrix paucivesiculata PCC 9631 TaxID=671071 RepID=A0A7Z9DXV9_9CYAN|nr:hypothetical protein [Planktothrix paucivesiculata]VXD17071.1 hypothetical protein PL9631_250157 [Planktothrix paucivesiculata PCC 9631]